MKRFAILLAAGTLAFSPATFAKPPENGKSNNAARTNGSGKVKAEASAKSRAKASQDYRPGGSAKAGVTAEGGAKWTYRGRQYDQFDVPAYRLPPGQAKKIFNRGERLPATYYARNPAYVLSNPAQYQLQPAPEGFQWVRVGDDVFLVRSENGLITQVVRRIFR